MRNVLTLAALMVVLTASVSPALAEGENPTSPEAAEAPLIHKAFGALAVCFSAALVIFTGAFGISRVASRGLDAIARQPEAAGSMFLAWLFPAVFIEGAMLFGLMICMMALDMIKG